MAVPCPADTPDDLHNQTRPSTVRLKIKLKRCITTRLTSWSGIMVQKEPDLRTVVYPRTAFAPETGSSGWMTCHCPSVSPCLPHYKPKITADQPDPL